MLVVFGRGVLGTDDGFVLTPPSAARVRAAVEYVAAHRAFLAAAAAHGRTPRVVFSGGWADACEGAPQPPAGCREGDLMLEQARRTGLDRYAELHAETRSRSTLENLLHIAGDGLLDGHAFTAAEPLGIVSHADHLPRVRFLAGKALGLPGTSLLDVPASGGETAAGWPSERTVRLAARLFFLGARDPAALLRRERRIVASVRRAERLTGRRPVHRISDDRV